MQNSILLSEIFGWMSLINVGVLSVASLALIWWGDKITSIHSRLFGVPVPRLKSMYMNYLAQYKSVSYTHLTLPTTPYV